MPETVKSWLPLSVITRIRLPRPRPDFLAVSASSTNWSAPCGTWPEVTSTELRGVSVQLPVRVGAPVVGPTSLLVAGSTRVAVATMTWPRAAFTPGSAASFSRVATGTVGVRPGVFAASSSCAFCTDTSEAVAANSRSKVVVAVL